MTQNNTNLDLLYVGDNYQLLETIQAENPKIASRMISEEPEFISYITELNSLLTRDRLQAYCEAMSEIPEIPAMLANGYLRYGAIRDEYPKHILCDFNMFDEDKINGIGYSRTVNKKIGLGICRAIIPKERIEEITPLCKARLGQVNDEAEFVVLEDLLENPTEYLQ